ncbi:MAG: SDR family NAD(P)-dependent oxidoreductase, partial [Chloroflexi bacterium]|nr:SDR family NAD(P)-dependent oxidoreductase [Chloroflexota bacterium]
MSTTSDDVDLTGQVALITGGGRGLGRAFAVGLAKAGASVGITARTQSEIDETAKLVEASGGQAIAFSADVTDKIGMGKVVASLEERFGPVDILVNNAGMITPLGNDWELDADEWWQTLTINVNGPYICIRAVMPSMMARRRGRIINITSIGAHTAT